MSLVRLTPPTTEPLSLVDAKLFLRVDTDADDTLIAALIGAARAHVETRTGTAIGAQSWRMIRDGWPLAPLVQAPIHPLRSIEAVRIYAADGTATTLSPAGFAIIDGGAAILVPAAAPWPGRSHGGIEIDVTVGYGTGGQSLPEPLMQAIRLILAHWYDNRVPVSDTATREVPHSVEALLAPWRVVRL